MDSEVYAFALKNTLDEIQKACPDIKNAFMLDQNHKIIAQDANTTEETLTRAVEILKEVFEKADTIGGVNDLTIEGINGRVNVSQIEEIYLVTVTNKKADLKYVDTVTHVLVPTVLKVIEKLNSSSPIPKSLEPEQKPEVESIEVEPKNPVVEEEEEEEEEEEQQEQPVREEELVYEEEARVEEPEEKSDEEPTEKTRPEPSATQFIVEDIKGLLSPSDTARVDSDVIEKWNGLYEDKAVEEAEIETFGGKSVRCKVKPIKDSKLEGQGKVQIPSKIQLVLDIKKGELVRVKPVVE